MNSTKAELLGERLTIRNLINRALKPRSGIKEVELKALFQMLRNVEKKIEQAS